jgi:putative acetyltransferase
MNIRKAKVSEAQAILDLNAETWRLINSKDYTKDQIEAWLRQQCKERIEQGIIAGNVTVCVDKRDHLLGVGARFGNEITGLYVSATLQRQGIGSKLLSQIEEDAKLEGINELQFHSTLTALPFYLKQGYTEISRDNWPLPNNMDLKTVNIKKEIKYNNVFKH